MKQYIREVIILMILVSLVHVWDVIISKDTQVSMQIYTQVYVYQHFKIILAK